MRKQVYQAPKSEMIEIEVQGVLCSSGGTPSIPNPSGSTESVGRSTFGF